MMRGAMIIGLGAAMAGCTQFGPGVVRGGRVLYNQAIAETSNEQLLLNIVRLQYRDVPVFLEVTSVSTSVTFGAGLEPEVSIFEGPGNDGIDGTIGSLSYEEQPTITYLPLQGERFVRQLLTPISADQIELLYYSGWSVDRILRVCVQRMGRFQNAPSASGPTPVNAPTFREFRELTALLREFQIAGALSVGQLALGSGAGADARAALVIEIDRSALSPEQDEALLSMVDLDVEVPDVVQIVLTEGVIDHDAATVTMVTRSLMAAMFYLAQGVDVPDRDREIGRVTVTREADGTPFDWGNLLDGLFEVHESKDRPQNAYASVWYRDRWFYIDDSDRRTKSTFSLLNQLLALQAGEFESKGPILTLPVGN
ncbi:MAG: hypothetical protein AAGI53_03635 [Planctomycetota bacterium]